MYGIKITINGSIGWIIGKDSEGYLFCMHVCKVLGRK